MTTRIYADRRALAQGGPAVAVETDTGTVHCREAEIQTPDGTTCARVLHSDTPRAKGVRVWVETEHHVVCGGAARA